MHAYWATGFINSEITDTHTLKMPPLIILQKTLFEIMIFLLVITDFGSVQLKTLLNQHKINSKEFSVFHYFFLLNCYIINSGWSL